MGRGLKPDIVTYNTVISGFCYMKRLNRAIEFYENLMTEKHLQPYAITSTILIDAFCKEGRMVEAMLLFNKILDMGSLPNVVTYSCLVDGHLTV